MFSTSNIAKYPISAPPPLGFAQGSVSSHAPALHSAAFFTYILVLPDVQPVPKACHLLSCVGHLFSSITTIVLN